MKLFKNLGSHGFSHGIILLFFMVLFGIGGAAYLVITQAAPTRIRIVGVGSGKCLDIKDRSNTYGATIQVWDCLGTSNQNWTWEPRDHNGGFIRNPSNGRCLSTSGASDYGSQIILGDCNPSQKWIYHNGTIRSLSIYNVCMDVRGYGTTNGSVVQLYKCANPITSNQKWTLR